MKINTLLSIFAFSSIVLYLFSGFMKPSIRLELKNSSNQGLMQLLGVLGYLTASLTSSVFLTDWLPEFRGWCQFSILVLIAIILTATWLRKMPTVSKSIIGFFSVISVLLITRSYLNLESLIELQVAYFSIAIGVALGWTSTAIQKVR